MRAFWRRAGATALLAGAVLGFGLFILLVSPIGHTIYARTVSASEERMTTPLKPDVAAEQQLIAAALRQSRTTTHARPIRLMIPRLGLSAAIERVGLTRSGAMAVPKSPMRVAWYKYGPRPGNSGNAVIAGHSGYRSGVTAAFDNLPRLRKGDLVFVKDAKGVLGVFIVRKTRTFSRTARPGGVFENGRRSGRHLNLVTCTGAWNAAAGTHAKRLVVYTDALW